MLRDVDANSFASPLNDGLQKNPSEAQLAALKPQLEAFPAAFMASGEDFFTALLRSRPTMT